MRIQHAPKAIPLALIIVAGALLLLLLPPSQATAAVEDWQKGASIRSYDPEAFASSAYQRSIRELANVNANFVTLILPWKQEDLRSSSVYSVWATPATEALIEGIAYAHAQGLAVNLKPHLDVENYDWRARIDPRDPNAWFRSYGSMLVELAEIAEEHGVEMITIGSELITLTGSEHTSRWRNLIADVREVYSGDLTYSANWGGNSWSREKDAVEFWDALDYIGVAAYFTFNEPHTVDNIVQQWQRWDREHIRPLYERNGKPIIFTEVGYRSIRGSLRSPWDWDTSGRVDEQSQAAGYEAMFSYWARRDYFIGVHLWDWKTGTGPEYWESSDWASGYTPQRKAAEKVMEEWFARGAAQAVSQGATRAPQPISNTVQPPELKPASGPKGSWGRMALRGAYR